jgi:hypothetical protein
VTTSVDLIDTILANLDSPSEQAALQDFQFGGTLRNELLFFFKPECFLVDREASRRILQMSFGKLRDFSAQVAGALLLRGPLLERLGSMDRHYGFINRLSREASQIVTQDERAQIYQTLQLPSDANVPVLGGHEFMRTIEPSTETNVDQIWATKKSAKLRSGFYVQSYDVHNREVVVVNGFHPLQLRHFTGPDRVICLLLVHSNTAWKELRNDLIGATFPESANPNSIRGELYRNSALYGMESVSIANNCVHLSAGPFEAGFELRNFIGSLDNFRYERQHTRLYQEFTKQGLTANDFDRSLTNPTTGNGEDLYTATEDVDTEPAVALYKERYAMA